MQGTLIETDRSIFPNETESGHSLSIGIEKIRKCRFQTSKMAEVEIATSIIDENSYYSHQLNIKQGTWVFGQLCVSAHPHEHVVEIYLSASEQAGAESDKDHDCDVYISVSPTFPTIQRWDFRSNNKGSDHIKLPMYMEEFFESDGSIVIGVFGRGRAAQNNHCVLTLKVNTYENEELLHKFNLRRGQVLLPRDLGLNSKSKSKK